MRILALCCLAACGGSDVAVDAACEPSIVYLNRTGGDYVHGGRDNASLNQSALVDAPMTLAAWPHDDIDWRSLVDCITTALAPFPVAVTEIDPEMTTHLELVFTTTYWAGSAGTTMIVPDACRPGHQVEFVFGSALPTYARACQVALVGLAEMRAQLSLGDDCRDFVNNEQDCAPTRTFLDQAVTCVDAANQTTPCRCGNGETTENTYRAMAAAFPRCP